MDPNSCKHLAFLLSLGGVPLACSGDDGAGSESSTTGSEGTATESTTTGSTGSTDSEGTGENTSTAGETSSSSTVGETTGGGGSVCEGFATKYAECNPEGDLAMALDGCALSLELYAEGYEGGCVEAAESWLSCYAGATCAEIESGTACADEVALQEQACVLIIGDVCAAYGDKVMECDPDSSLDSESCQIGVLIGTVYISEACGGASEDYYACLGALDCAEFEAGTECESAFMTMQETCT